MKMRDYPDCQVYPAAYDDATRITTSNHAECGNGKHLSARRQNLLSASRSIMESEQLAHVASQREANDAKSLVPAQVTQMKEYKDAVQNAKVLRRRVTDTDQIGYEVKVLGARTSYNVSLTEFKCDCDVWPICAHLCAAATDIGQNIQSFFKAPLTVAHWKLHMLKVGDFPPVPSRAAVVARPDLIDHNLYIPLAMNKKAGAPPKKARRRGALELASEKRAKTLRLSTAPARHGPA